MNHKVLITIIIALAIIATEALDMNTSQRPNHSIELDYALTDTKSVAFSPYVAERIRDAGKKASNPIYIYSARVAQKKVN